MTKKPAPTTAIQRAAHSDASGIELEGLRLRLAIMRQGLERIGFESTSMADAVDVAHLTLLRAAETLDEVITVSERIDAQQQADELARAPV